MGLTGVLESTYPAISAFGLRLVVIVVRLRQYTAITGYLDSEAKGQPLSPSQQTLLFVVKRGCLMPNAQQPHESCAFY